MSGRIRSIKPELLEDTVTAGLSDMAHRIFIGIITLCEDSGRFRAEPGWLMGQVYWKRPVAVATFAAAIDELVTARLIVLYEASGQRYGVVRSWEKHQKISHRAPPRLPTPPWGDGVPPEPLQSPSGEPPELLRPDLRSPIPIPIPSMSPSGDGGADGPLEVWEHYVAVVKRHRPRRRPGLLSADDRKKIAAKLKTFSVEDLKAACTGLFRSQHHLGQNDRETEYLELEYALRKPAQMIALATENERPPATAPPQGDFVPVADVDALLESFSGIGAT